MSLKRNIFADFAQKYLVSEEYIDIYSINICILMYVYRRIAFLAVEILPSKVAEIANSIYDDGGSRLIGVPKSHWLLNRTTYVA